MKVKAPDHEIPTPKRERPYKVDFKGIPVRIVKEPPAITDSAATTFYETFMGAQAYLIKQCERRITECQKREKWLTEELARIVEMEEGD